MVEKKGEGRDDLIDFVREFTDGGTLAVEEKLGHGYVRLKVTEAERRQALQDIRCVEDVVKELVRNASDAGAAHIYVTFQKEKGRWRNVTVLDDGSGIPDELHRKIFEARVTSKVDDVVEDGFGVHGRGMALFSIRHVADEVSIVDSREREGTIINARLDTNKTPEKKDQSTFPRLESDEGGRIEIAGGPHNVPRILSEFVLRSGKARIYLGSNAEILATLYEHSLEMRRKLASGNQPEERCLWFELGRLKEGRLLHAFAREKLGLEVSERNAYRILEHEIQPLISINELLGRGESAMPNRRSDLQGHSKGDWGDHLSRRLSKDDLTLISGRLHEAFKDIGERYYLESDEPVVKRRKNRLIISLYLREPDID